MTEPKISVVMPIGRVDEQLVDQLNALAAQDFDLPWELVIGLNSATGRAILDSHLENFKGEVVVVEAFDRANAAYARNTAASEARSGLLAFCDSDDICETRWLHNIFISLDQNSNVAVGGHLDEIELAISGQENWRPPATPNALPTFMGAPFLVSANMGISLADFKKVGGFPTDLSRGEDIAFSWNLIAAGLSLIYVADAVVHYRHRVGFKHLMSQHYKYGRGLSEVLNRYDPPGSDAGSKSSLLTKFKPNGAKVDNKGVIHYARRSALAAGRLVGLVVDKRLRTASLESNSKLEEDGK